MGGTNATDDRRRLAAVLLALAAALSAGPGLAAAAAAGTSATVPATTTATAPAVTNSAAATATRADVALTVSVVTPAGEGVADATVTATWANGSTSARTASNGKVFLDVPRGANVTLTVDHPEYVRNVPVEVRDASEESVTIEVRRAGSLSVTVSDSEGSLADARVALRQDGRVVASARTDAGGNVSFGPVEQREYVLVVRKAGYYTERVNVTIDGDNEVSVSVETGTVTLTVRVVDDHFEEPRAVGNATVRVHGIATLRTLSSGSQTVSVPVNTDVEVSVTKPAYERVNRTVEVGESPVNVTLGVSRADALTITPANERVVVGESVEVVVRDEYGVPVEGATVRLDGTVVGETGAEGRLRVPIESAGDHELVAETDAATAEAVTVRGIRASTPRATPTASPTPTERSTASPVPPTTVVDDGGGLAVPVPGFGPAPALAAVALAALFAVRRSRSRR